MGIARVMRQGDQLNWVGMHDTAIRSPGSLFVHDDLDMGNELAGWLVVGLRSASPQNMVATGSIVDPQNTASQCRVAKFADPFTRPFDIKDVTSTVGWKGCCAAYHAQRAVWIPG